MSYIGRTTQMCAVLKDQFNISGNLLQARRSNLIPKEGNLEDVYFSFHGVGCYFEFLGGSVDLDFGPNGNCRGFDQFRLFDYLSSMDMKSQKEFTVLLDENHLKDQFNMLAALGVIINPKLPPASHLYFLSDDGW